MANVPLAKAKFPTEAHLINNFHKVQSELKVHEGAETNTKQSLLGGMEIKAILWSA